MNVPESSRPGLIKRLASVLGKPGKDKPADLSEGPPRPELGQSGITGDARYSAGFSLRKWDNESEEWVLAHRIDNIRYKDLDRVRFYPTVRDALMAIRLPLTRANFHFECANQDCADLAMQELGPHIRHLVDKLAKGGLEFGRQTAEKVWQLKMNVKVSGSQAETGPTEMIYPFVWSIKRFAFFSPEDTDILIRPRTGEFAGIRQYVGSMYRGQMDIKASKLIHFAHDPEFDSNYGTARTKAAIPFVDQALGVYDDASLYFARFACPSLIGYAPATKREVGTDSAGKPILKDSIKWLSSVLAKFRNAHSIVLPDERNQDGSRKWEIQPLELGERGLFVEYALHLNTMIGASICVPQMALSTVPSSGTYNLGESQIDLFTQNGEALLDAIRDVINSDLCDDFRVYNFGQDCPPLRVVFEPLSTDVTKALLDGLVQNLVMGAPLYTSDGQQIQPDWAKLASDKGVPVTLTKPSQIPGVPAGADPSNPGGEVQGMPQDMGGPPEAGLPDMTYSSPSGGRGSNQGAQPREKTGAKGTGSPGTSGGMSGEAGTHTDQMVGTSEYFASAASAAAVALGIER